MNGPSTAALLSVFLVLYGLVWLVRRFPATWWARLLRSAHGPRLDAEQLTRGECLRAAAGFALIALLGFSSAGAAAWFAERFTPRGLEAPAALVLLFAYSVVGMMGVGGALYLLAWAPFRPRTGPPARVPHDNPTARVDA